MVIVGGLYAALPWPWPVTSRLYSSAPVQHGNRRGAPHSGSR